MGTYGENIMNGASNFSYKNINSHSDTYSYGGSFLLPEPPEDPYDEWTQLGLSFYRKWDAYNYEDRENVWGVDLGDYHIEAAKNGGPIALRKKHSPFGQGKDQHQHREQIRIHSGAGKLISIINIDPNFQVIAHGWTEKEELVLLYHNGILQFYDLLGRILENRTLNILPNSGLSKINAKIYSTGLVGLLLNTGSNKHNELIVLRFYHKNGQAVRGDDERELSEALLKHSLVEGSDLDVTSFELIDSSITNTGDLEVLIAYSDKTLALLDANGQEEDWGNPCLNDDDDDEDDDSDEEKEDSINCFTAPVLLMSVCPNGKFLACICADGKLVVLDIANAEPDVIMDYRIEDEFLQNGQPNQVTWCGDDAVLVGWDSNDPKESNGVLMVGPEKDYIHIQYNDAVQILTEYDYARIISQTSIEILQLVPSHTVEIHDIESYREPAAKLYGAMIVYKYEKNTLAYQEAMSEFSDSENGPQDLDKAIDQNIKAALYEWEGPWQQLYMQAAYEGKMNNDDLDPNRFVSACKKLRILNNLRTESIGIAMSYQQFELLGIKEIIYRLIRRRNHLFAMKICEYLQLSVLKQQVLVSWACDFINSERGKEMTDNDIVHEIRYKLQGVGKAIPYAKIAREANNRRGKNLAKTLLAFDNSSFEKVKLLLELEDIDEALQKAVDSKDQNLIHLALIGEDGIYAQIEQKGMKNSAGEVGLLNKLYKHPYAVDFLLAFYFEQVEADDATNFLTITKQKGQFMSAAKLRVQQAYLNNDFNDRQKIFKETELELKMAAQEFPYAAPMTAENCDLLTLQRKIASKYNYPINDFVGHPLSYTIFELIYRASKIEDSIDSKGGKKDTKAMIKDAKDLKTKFKVPEKRYYHIRIRAHAKARNWSKLKEFSEEKKPPMGYKSFALACIDAKENDSDYGAGYYIAMVKDPIEKYELCKAVENYEGAKAVVLNHLGGDTQLLSELQALSALRGR